jgi:hypothetical protein
LSQNSVGFVVRGNLKQMIDLRAVGKERNIDISAENLLNRRVQRRQIFRQRPAIDGISVTTAPRLCSAAVSSGLAMPYSWIAIRLPCTLTSASSVERISRQVLGSGTVTAACSPNSFNAAIGLGPRATS